jgi:hypothetical protein
MTDEYIRFRLLHATLPQWATYRRFERKCCLYYQWCGGQRRNGLGNGRNTLVRNVGKHPKTQRHMREDRNGDINLWQNPQNRRISVCLFVNVARAMMREMVNAEAEGKLTLQRSYYCCHVICWKEIAGFERRRRHWACTARDRRSPLLVGLPDWDADGSSTR